MKKLIGFIFLLLFSCTEYSVEEIETESPVVNSNPQSFKEDPIYSKIDPMDPYSFLDAFLEDAKRYGVNIPASSISVKFEFLDSLPYPERRLGAAVHPCVPNRVYLLLETKFWNDATTLDFQNYRKLQLMWHEFGHSLLKLDHTCNRNHIMTSNTPSCPETELGWFYDLWYLEYNGSDPSTNWQRAVKDMFEGVDQSYFACNTNIQSIVH